MKSKIMCFPCHHHLYR